LLAKIILSNSLSIHLRYEFFMNKQILIQEKKRPHPRPPEKNQEQTGFSLKEKEGRYSAYHAALSHFLRGDDEFQTLSEL
jgi:hypothetical protein